MFQPVLESRAERSWSLFWCTKGNLAPSRCICVFGGRAITIPLYPPSELKSIGSNTSRHDGILASLFLFQNILRYGETEVDPAWLDTLLVLTVSYIVHAFGQKNSPDNAKRDYCLDSILITTWLFLVWVTALFGRGLLCQECYPVRLNKLMAEFVLTCHSGWRDDASQGWTE